MKCVNMKCRLIDGFESYDCRLACGCDDFIPADVPEASDSSVFAGWVCQCGKHNEWWQHWCGKCLKWQPQVMANDRSKSEQHNQRT